MEPYDIFMIAVLLGSILFGAWKGLAWQLASIAALVVSYFVAFQFREPVSNLIKAEPPWNKVAAMAIVYVVCSLGIWIAFGFVRRFIDKVKLKDFDRHAGALVGAVNGVILCTVITLFAVTLLDDEKKHMVCCSHSGYYIAKGIDRVYPAMPPEAHDILGPYLERLDNELEHDHEGPELTHDRHDNHNDGDENVPTKPVGVSIPSAARDALNSLKSDGDRIAIPR
jgi:membrane protein required for colicin V production